MTEAAGHQASLRCPEGDPGPHPEAAPSSVESYEFEAGIGLNGVSRIKVKVQTALWSSMSKAGTALVASTGGCLCTVILHETGAPEWAQLAGMLLPWLIVISLELFEPRRRRLSHQRRLGRGSQQHG